MIGEHFWFTALMGVILLTSFTIVSLVPLIGARLERRDKEPEDS